MVEKSGQSSEDEVKTLIEQFGLDGLTEKEKEMLTTLAENKALVSPSSDSVPDLSFRKTLIEQNWMILSRLTHMDKELEILADQ